MAKKKKVKTVDTYSYTDKEVKEPVQKAVQVEVPTLSDDDMLRAAINGTIEIANRIMANDRSRVLRLKSVVGKLKDALKVVK